jgi:hypothetical protein
MKLSKNQSRSKNHLQITMHLDLLPVSLSPYADPEPSATCVGIFDLKTIQSIFSAKLETKYLYN